MTVFTPAALLTAASAAPAAGLARPRNIPGRDRRWIGLTFKRLNRGPGSTLRPRQPFGLPASKPPSLSRRIEWPLESVGYVAAARKARRR
jgi:hypothetical protein